MREKKVIGFVSTSNPHTDRMAWSGIIYKTTEAIKNAGYDVLWIKYSPSPVLSFIIKAVLFLSGLANNWYWRLTRYFGILCSRSVCIEDIQKCDYLFFCDGSPMIGYLKTRVIKNLTNCPPIIYYTDTTFRLMVDYYWHNIPNWIRIQSDSLEKKAYECSNLIIKASNWAINSVINDYDCPKSRTAVIEFGANIDEKDIVISDSYIGGELNILFSGVDWGRKGGDIAIDAVKLLNEKGISTKLYLVGLDEDKIPSAYQKLSYVKYVGFLNKNNPEQYKRYLDIISQCHCLLLPTHAECAGIVFNEAAACGLPSFTYDTGGIANYVVNGKTGYRLNIHSSAHDFANVIEEVVRNNKFEELHKGALMLYKERNNWVTWSQRFSDLIESVSG